MTKIQYREQELAEIKKSLSQHHDLDEMWLFGSQAKNKAQEWSDIDIALIAEDFKENSWEKQIELSVKANKINDNLELHLFSSEEFANPYDPLAAEIKKYGVQI